MNTTTMPLQTTLAEKFSNFIRTELSESFAQKSTLLIWTIAQLSYFYYYGMSKGGDSISFILGADEFLKGNIANSGVHDYFTYVLLMSVIKLFSLPPLAVIPVQIALHLIATYCLFKSLIIIYKNPMAAMIVCYAFCVAPFAPRWSLYILSDSLFISGIPIAFYLFLTATTPWKKAFTVIVTFFLIISRPNGIILLAGIAAFILTKFVKSADKKKLWDLGIGFVLLLPAMLLFIERKFAAIGVLDIYLKGNIVWSFEKGSLIFPPNGFVPKTSSELLNLALFAFNNFGYFIKLSLLKIYYFLSFSLPINGIVYQALGVFWWTPTYILLFLGLKNGKSGLKIEYKAMMITAILAQIFMVAITYNDYDMRFMQHIMPILAILWAGAITQRSFYDFLKFKPKSMITSLVSIWPMLMATFFFCEYLTIIRHFKELLIYFSIL